MSPRPSFRIALQHQRDGRLADAETICRQILAAEPNDIETLMLFGALALQTGNAAAAVTLFERASAIKSDRPEVWSNLGAALRAVGRIDEALAANRRAVALNPGSAEFHYNLGNALNFACRSDEAASAYRRAIELRPDYPEAWNNLGCALHATGLPDEAEAACREAIRLYPPYSDAHKNLGVVHLATGRVAEAIRTFRRALDLDPSNSSTHSHLLIAMNYSADCEAVEILSESKRWEAQHTKDRESHAAKHPNDRSPDRRLRIGYVSADFRWHVVGRSMLGLLQEHDRDRFESFCYSGTPLSDSLTDDLRNAAPHWRDISRMSNDDLVRTIHADHIDILVDLALHTPGNRLLAFAQKPAPIQVSYLGYCGTTGLSAIDYRFSDPQLDPPGGQECSSETTWRLPMYWCYEPLKPTPPVSTLPAFDRKYVTFGCLNNFTKVSPNTQDAWIEILRATPDSQLRVHSLVGRHRETFRSKFSDAGISPERIEFVGVQSWDDYVQSIQSLDVGLDPFPYCGGITTCDALWMGIPVVTLSGQTAVGRAGRTILSNVDLFELVANRREEYVQIATGLAKNLPRLAELRSTLRESMERSQLRDASRHACEVESAYREMWRMWCGKEGAVSEV
jgi:predicted O-linked N-acetylglucosamine transferase (SPINDLY family)